jgi:hypothetical protein
MHGKLMRSSAEEVIRLTTAQLELSGDLRACQLIGVGC